MTMFWTVAALMTVAALAAVIVPLLRRPGQSGPGRAEFDLTVYKDQLAEIGRDRERGLLGEAEAEAARIEIQRRMLKATGTEDSGGPGGDADGGGANTGQRSLSRALAAILAAAMPVAALGFYFVLGSPNLPDLPHAERDIGAEIVAREGRLERAEVMQLTARLLEALKDKPGDVKGWLLLARTYLTINEFEGALDAFRRATELSNRRPEIAASYAEAMVMAEGGQVPATAKKLFNDILAADPFNSKARYYLGLEMAQTGNPKGALQAWVDLAELSPADAPWLNTVNRQIASAARELGVGPGTVKPSARAMALALTMGLGAPRTKSLPATSMPPAATPAPISPSASPSTSPGGPSAADVLAASRMSATDRDRMIRSMVKRLADRLADNPGDLEGWRRLAKAYEVLGDEEKAEDARKRIEALTK